MTYTQLLNTALELLDEQGPQQAFDFMQQQSPNVEYANPAQLYNFSYCLAAMCDRTDEAMGLLKEAVYTHGYWYDYTYLMEDEDLAQLRSMPEFETIANLCRQRQQAAQQAAQPVLCCEETQPNKPVVLVLHGDQQNAAITLPYWQPVKQIGYALAAAQSTELQVSDGYLWDDEEQAAPCFPLEGFTGAGRAGGKQHPRRIFFRRTRCFVCGAVRCSRTKGIDSGGSLAAGAGGVD